MTVTFFGHRDTPKDAEPILRSAITDLIENYNADEFYVGINGSFDSMVRRQLKELSDIYPIHYSVALAYLPEKNNDYDDFSDTILPEGIENTPKRFAIAYRNNWMLKQSDAVITYVKRTYGGAWQFKQKAEKQGKKIIELSKLINL